MKDEATEKAINEAYAAIDLKAKTGEKFTDDEVTEELYRIANNKSIEYKGTFSYMLEMQAYIAKGKRLSTGQARGVLNCLVAEARRALPKPETAPVNTTAIIAFFDAVKGLKWPKVKLQLNGEPVIIKAKRQGIHKGAVEILGEYEWNERFMESMPHWYGRIEADGTVVQGKGWTKVEPLVREFAEDPAKTASEYGRLTGNCCFCSLPLSDERSTAMGYGPICAQHWNLPWGVEKTDLKTIVSDKYAKVEKADLRTRLAAGASVRYETAGTIA